jgi:uncharacterized hydrophobic protein (TIGR00271 family)
MKSSPLDEPASGLLRESRDRLAFRFGITPENRREVVRAMRGRHGKERAGYWFQLVLALGIATYGLVLGSTGVVIGAMLISPLMSPLVEIGMGLVVGSAVLALHAAARTVMSVAVVIAASACLSYLLPYHELTGEIAARTSPTLIDLYVASFCALAAAYTTARQSSDTVSAAAGTAISISLVPPLCVVGWGLGSRALHASAGAAMLFTANLCAILLFTAIAFLALGFDAVRLDDPLDDGSMSERVALRLHGFFGTKYGPLLRLLMPVALVGAVFVPLRRALDQVAWKTHVRTQVERILRELPAAEQAVQSGVVIENHSVSIRLLVVASPREAHALETHVKQRIAASTGVTPAVEVVAVPDEASVRLMAQAAASPKTLAPARSKLDAGEWRRAIDAALRSIWPARAGELRTWRLVLDGEGSQTLVVVHFGEPLGGPGEELLATSLGDEIAGNVAIQDVALSSAPADAEPAAGAEWLPKLRRTVDAALRARAGVVCVTSAAVEDTDPSRALVEQTSENVRAELARLPPAQVAQSSGRAWHVALVPEACPAPDAIKVDAGVDAGSTDAGVTDAGTASVGGSDLRHDPLR